MTVTMYLSLRDMALLRYLLGALPSYAPGDRMYQSVKMWSEDCDELNHTEQGQPLIILSPETLDYLDSLPDDVSHPKPF